MAMATEKGQKGKKKGPTETLPRVHESRLSLVSGLNSMRAREKFEKLRKIQRSKKKADTSKPSEDVDRDKVGAMEVEPSGSSDTADLDGADLWDSVNDVAVRVGGSRIHGWGLFADQPFRKGDVVAEYVGEYIRNAVADAREKMYQERRIQDYQFRVDENLVIDATLHGGHGRYINHNCNPNCVARIVDGKAPNKHLKRVMIIAQRDIKPREEITYDYQVRLVRYQFWVTLFCWGAKILTLRLVSP
jgi:histone-lysine N-methyltransferase SETD1